MRAWGLLGDPTRRAIFEMLARRPCSVRSSPTSSRSAGPRCPSTCGCSRTAAWSSASAEGTRRIYRLNPEGVDRAAGLARRRLGRRPRRFHKAADADGRRPDHRTGEPMTTTPRSRPSRHVTVGVPIEQAFACSPARSTPGGRPVPHRPGRGRRSDPRAAGRRALVRARRRRHRVRLGPGAGLGAARTGWCSPGRSTATGSSTPTPRTPARSRPASAPTGPAQTTVEVEHRHFERLVGGQAIHDAIRGGGGWALLLDAFAKTVADQR